MSTIFRRFLSVCVSVAMCITVLPASSYALETNRDSMGDGEFEALGTGVITSANSIFMPELISEESSETVSVYDLGEGERKAIFYSSPVRFRDGAGELLDYEPELVSASKTSSHNKSLSGYVYENKSGDSKAYFPSNISRNPILLEKDNYSISLIPKASTISQLKKTLFSAVKASIESGETLSLMLEKESKNLNVVYGDKTSDTFIEYTSLNNGVKESIILHLL